MTCTPTRPRASRLLAIVAGVGGLALLALSAGCTAEQNAAMKTYTGINAIRAQRGLPALQPDAGLIKVANIRSRDMAARGYFSHNPPDGCNYVCLLDTNQVPYAYAGENIAWNNWDWSQTADRAVAMWQNSPPHMENILGCRYERFGTGVAKSPDGRIYYTMIFEGNAAC